MPIVRASFWVALLAALPLLAGCGSDSPPQDEEDDEDEISPAEQACLDTADALAGSAQRCGLDYKANFDAFVDAAAMGDCSNIVAVRDREELYGECVPFLKGLTCDQVNDPNLVPPAACENQLIRLE